MITAVVNLHDEGATAEPSLISAWRAVQRAQRSGLSADLLLVLDAPDDATASLAERWGDRRDVRSITISEGDLGAARNASVAGTDATWLAFLDADDLWGEEWLVAAASAADGASEFDVFHPQVNIIFGDHHSLLHHIDSESPDFRWSRFSLHNAWTALSFVNRETIVQLPYPRNELAYGFGFEDWSWNMAVLDAGGRHRVVADTCHFIKRTSGGSLLADSQRALRTRYPHGPVAPERQTSGDVLTGPVDPSTHRIQAVDLGPKVFEQIQLAATIEPAVTATLSAAGTPEVLPQNFNTHNTAAQFALEELWSLRSPDRSIGEILDRATRLSVLDSADRALVVAEFFLSEKALGRPVGHSEAITEATAVFSQLSSAL